MSEEEQDAKLDEKKLNESLKICSWNINGIRTICLQDTLKTLDCSILSVQETKISRDLLDEQLAFVDGFTSYFSFCRNRTGYSGVATYCRSDITPVKSEEGLSGLLHEKYSKSTDNVIGCYCDLDPQDKSHALHGDDDGRSILTQHEVQTPSGEIKPLTLINVYCPRLRDDPTDMINNTEFKLAFHSIMGNRAQRLVEAGSFVIILGDLNISHNREDRCESEEKVFCKDVFREWMDELLKDGQFQDSFRTLHPTKKYAFSCWCTRTNARQNNFGSRIDYIIVDKNLSQYLLKAEIHSEILGSDHCPISATFHSLKPVASPKPPAECTKYFREFAGKQTKLQQFLKKSDAADQNPNPFKKELQLGVSTKAHPMPKNKKDTPKGGKQTNLTSFFAKKPKLDEESEYFRKKQCEDDTNDNVNKIVCSEDRQVDAEMTSSQYIKESNSTDVTKAWKSLMSGVREIPVCSGHKEPCHEKTVKKKGVNQGRKFWSCARGVAGANDPNGSCNFFVWATNTK